MTPNQSRIPDRTMTKFQSEALSLVRQDLAIISRYCWSAPRVSNSNPRQPGFHPLTKFPAPWDAIPPSCDGLKNLDSKITEAPSFTVIEFNVLVIILRSWWIWLRDLQHPFILSKRGICTFNFNVLGLIRQCSEPLAPYICIQFLMV
jgi:hypothetical protein